MKTLKKMFFLIFVVAIVALAACSNASNSSGSADTGDTLTDAGTWPDGAKTGGGGGGGGGGPVTPPAISVTVTPATANVAPGDPCQFTATVTNSSAGVDWTVPGPSTIDATGLLTVDPGVAVGSSLTVTAKSVEDSSKSGTATVNVSAAVTLSITAPSDALSPLQETTPGYSERSVDFDVTISGLTGTDTVSLSLATNSNGLSLEDGDNLDNSGPHTLKLKYNGSGTGGSVTVDLVAASFSVSGYTLSGSTSVSVDINDGSAAYPIPLNAANFDYFSDYANNEGLAKNYILTVTVTAPASWTRIGTSSTNCFTGSFDGGGNEIDSLVIPAGSYQGLFGYIGTGGVVKNVGLTSISGGGDGYIGGVAGQNDGTVENCYVTGTIGGTNRVGGVVGRNNYIVQYCYFDGILTASSLVVGGVAGESASGGSFVRNCYSKGSITGTQSAGGIVGYLANSTVQNCYTTSNITISAGGTNAGGIAGNVSSSGTQILNCVALNTISGGSSNLGRVAGLAGYIMTNNYADDSTPFYGGGSASATGIHGADATAGVASGQYNNEDFWIGTGSTMGWSDTIWDMTTGMGNLPTLQ